MKRRDQPSRGHNNAESETEAILRARGGKPTTSRAGGLPQPPKRHLAVVACMDARLDVYDILGLEPGDAHVIRNAGGVITDDVIRSLMISQRMLGTNEVILIHHTDCGMQKFDGEQLKRDVEAETGQRPAFPIQTFTDIDFDVRESIAAVMNCPFLPSRTRVRGFVFDVHDGTLREVTRVPALSGHRELN